MGNTPHVKYLAIISICALVAFWVHKKYESDSEASGQRFFDTGMDIIERSIIEAERKENLEIETDKLMLEKYLNGELPKEEYEAYLQRQDDREKLEYDQTVELLGQYEKMLNPESGMLSGLIKSETDSDLKKNKQIAKLDQEIMQIISESDGEKSKITKMKLLGITWVPIGKTEIDNEMTKYYEEKIQKLIEQL